MFDWEIFFLIAKRIMDVGRRDFRVVVLQKSFLFLSLHSVHV